MSRRTVDITVDAYDAPSLIAVARERERQRDIGHDDAMTGEGCGMPMKRVFRKARASYIGIATPDVFRELNGERESIVGVMLEEVSEAVEELMKLDDIGYREGDMVARERSEAAETELTQAAAVMLRIASKLRAERLGGA
jgi:hypothetical protein